MKRYIQIYLHRIIPPNHASCIFRNYSICKATIKLKEREKTTNVSLKTVPRKSPFSLN